MPTSYKLNALSRILILLAFCRLSTTQILYVGDFCDFANYEGTCLEASKCEDLQPIMQELGFERHQVGRCGFEVREEIICCPKRPTPIQTPPKLSNEFTDLSKHPAFGYTRPAGSVFNPGSIPITTNTPIIIKQNSNGNRESVQSENDRLKVVFNGNTGEAGTGSNVGEWNSKFFSVANGNNNGIFSANPLPNVIDSTRLNGNPVQGENEQLKKIFGENPEIGNGNSNNNGFNANPIPNINNNKTPIGNPVFDEKEVLKSIFGDKPVEFGEPIRQEEGKRALPIVPVENGNNNGGFNTKPLVNDNQKFNGNPAIDENERFKAIFDGNTGQPENENMNGIFIASPEFNINNNKNLNGNPYNDENEIFNVTFNGNPGQPENENINGIFNASPEFNINNNKNLNGNQFNDENERFKAIFDGNPGQPENENINGIFKASPEININNNKNLNGNPFNDENERFKAIFDGNTGQPENENINGIFSASPEININNNKHFRGNPFNDENEIFNVIFNGNPGQAGGVNNIGEEKVYSAPYGNEINNDYFNANPMANENDDQKLNDNANYDASERLNEIFGDNPPQLDNRNNGGSNAVRNGEIDRNHIRFEHDGFNLNFNRNPISIASEIQTSNGNTFPSRYDSSAAFGNENMNGLFNGKPLLAEHPNEGMLNVFSESGNPLNNEHRQHLVRLQEALHRRRLQPHRRLDRNKTRLASRRNQRFPFYK